MKINVNRSAVLYFVSCVLFLSLQSCGFHLRGSVQLPPEMERTYIQGSGSASMMQELRRSLTASGATLVAEVDQATAILEIVQASQDRRVLTVGSSARVREYELSYTVEFGVHRRDGAVLVPVQTLQLRRDYVFDENDVLGKSSEEELVRQEMEREVAHSLLRRLRVGK